MGWEVWVTLGVVAAVLVLLAGTRAPAEMLLLGAMIVLSVSGVLEPTEALSGFSNPGVMTIAALYVVVAGLRQTGAIAWFSRRVFGRPGSLLSAQVKLMGAGGLLSTVINNTPVVAMFIPIAQDWSARHGLPIRRLLLPLNNVVILAGLCTLIGTSTNLAVYGLLMEVRPDAELGLFDLVWIGLPLTVAGFVYALVASRWLLGDRPGPAEPLDTLVQDMGRPPSVPEPAPPDTRRAPVALGILVIMILVATAEWVPLFEASFIAAGLMVVTRCLTTEAAGQSIQYRVVAGIAASFALGVALVESGAAALVGGWLVDVARGNPLASLVALYVATVIVTELVTNNAAGVLMFPIALAVAEAAGADFMPFVIAVMVGASAGFITPIGYQTNLMIYGPGGYRFMDFVRFGMPLSVLCGIITLLVVPRVWPF
jgi:di/tricarboxylate transporter